MSDAVRGQLVDPASRQRLVGVLLSKRKYPVRYALLFNKGTAGFIGGQRFGYWLEDTFTSPSGVKTQPVVDAGLFNEIDRMVLIPNQGWTVASTQLHGWDGEPYGGVFVRMAKGTRSKNAWRPRYGGEGINLTDGIPDRRPVSGRYAVSGTQEIGFVPNGESILYLKDGVAFGGHTEVSIQGKNLVAGGKRLGVSLRNRDDSIWLKSSAWSFRGAALRDRVLLMPQGGNLFGLRTAV